MVRLFEYKFGLCLEVERLLLFNLIPVASGYGPLLCNEIEYACLYYGLFVYLFTQYLLCLVGLYSRGDLR